MAADPTPFKSLNPRPGTRTIPPVQVQLDHMAAVITKLVEAAGDIELRQLFTMRQIRMGRTKPGTLVDPVTGKLPIQHITLADLFDSQRDVFVQQLMQEMAEARNENADPQTSVSDQGDGHGASASSGTEAEGRADAPTPHIVIAES